MILLEKISRFLILTFPIAIISVKVLGPLIYVVLALIGMYWILKKKASPFTIPELKLFSWLTFGYFIVMVLSVVLSNEPSNDWTHLSRKAQFLIAPFVGITFYYTKISIKNMITSLKIGTIVIGIIVWTEYFLGGYGSRLSGMFNPNTFGDITLVMVWMAVAAVSKESQHAYRYSIISMLLGASAVVMSGSRGSMMVFVLLLFVYTILSYYTRTLRIRGILVVLAAIVSFGSTIFVTGTLFDRIDHATQDISQWQIGENKTSSVGVRLEMYHAGWQAFLDAPWFGYGYRNANEVASRYVEGEAKEDIANYTHLHNEYLTNMVSAGILGLVALMTLFAIPIREIVRYIQHPPLKIFGIMGIFLISGYMFSGLTHGMLEWEYENSFFLFFLGFLLMSIKKERILE